MSTTLRAITRAERLRQCGDAHIAVVNEQPDEEMYRFAVQAEVLVSQLADLSLGPVRDQAFEACSALLRTRHLITRVAVPPRVPTPPPSSARRPSAHLRIVPLSPGGAR